MRRLIFLLLSVVLLAACSPTQPILAQPTPDTLFVTATLSPTRIPLPTSSVIQGTPTPTTDPTTFRQLFPESNAGNELTLIDQQGLVTVEVTPVNLRMPGDTLVFEVAMNTHSVDLSMDLAQLATLTTDTGKVIQATVWEAPRGGHHVSGQLIFPATFDGVSILDGVTKLTLDIHDVDAESRIFTWTLP